MHAKDHWNHVYATKPATGVSWYQEHAEQSLRLIRQTGLGPGAAIIDVGAGASTLVDDLLDEGHTALTVLDLSASALATAQARLGPRAQAVRWLEGNILDVDLAPQSFDLWHDRAVFHFLTTEAERQAYVRQVLRAVKPEGHVIVATFAEDGPTQCSGLPVMRYSPTELHGQFGDPFVLLGHEREEHQTPFGTRQKFIYCYCRLASPRR
ncbi:MAG: class I SAM-dependent methyltransferase [Pseudomonadota bacterium]